MPSFLCILLYATCRRNVFYPDLTLLPFPHARLHSKADLIQRKEEARIAKERKELAWRRDHAYDDVMTEDNLEQSSNQNRDENFLDDFM